MVTDQQRRTRRSILKAIPVSGLAISATGTAAANHRDCNQYLPDTTFDPTENKEVARFVKQSDQNVQEVENIVQNKAIEKSILNDLNKEVANDLSSEQIEAVNELLSEGEMVVEHTSSAQTVEESTVSATSVQSSAVGKPASYKDSAKAKIKVPVIDYSVHAFTFTHSIEWEYNPGKTVKAMNASASGKGRIVPPAKWNYEGNEDKKITKRADGNFFVSDATGKFDRCAITKTGLSCLVTDRLYTRLSGDWNGTGKRLRKNLIKG
ncbi:hypothetical protein Natpe_2058 [Natrinema pellirubrum DSM 15624]|uniref:Uncharacterized protein n=1 Tax=Natrinema pellirubrum (strain DSM 15624 / CIP 106293 / JCM 10476 / NCIMB 786 / 157) TaxID=797303 RepID=L0JMT8_NATP1|nr:hypothetical protein [Natrinema pellirubrum]AGB31887.1 hypothetical protein Natpe_2058 [Natrinema pellirubrum DSM 15624]